MKKVSIAGINIEMEYDSTEFFDNRLKQYEISGENKDPDRYTQKDDIEQNLMHLKTTAYEMVKEPKGKVLSKVGASTMLQTSPDERCIYAVSPKTGMVTTATYFNNTFSKVNIEMLREFDDAMFSLTEREYIRTGLAFKDRLAYCGGLALHGSAISYAGHGIIFSAPSGTGKSTHTGLWKSYFGGSVSIINDDKPAIRFKIEKDAGIEMPYVYGTPWSGKTDINSNTSSPLKAIVFLKQSKINRIEKLGTEDSMYLLASETTSPFYDSGLGMKILLSMEKLVKIIPIYMLHCDISYEAVKVVYDEIFN